jgi:hypothetical protein
MLIFLDIDGVMVPARGWKSPELLNDGFPEFSSKAISVLQNLLSEATTVLLTTSHKSRFTIEEWKNIFQKRGLKIDRLESLTDNVNSLSRKDEILNWFNLNNVTDEFIIMDDDKSLNDLPPFLKNRLILTSSLIGLTDNHLCEIKNILSQRTQIA